MDNTQSSWLGPFKSNHDRYHEYMNTEKSHKEFFAKKLAEVEEHSRINAIKLANERLLKINEINKANDLQN